MDRASIRKRSTAVEALNGTRILRKGKKNQNCECLLPPLLRCREIDEMLEDLVGKVHDLSYGPGTLFVLQGLG